MHSRSLLFVYRFLCSLSSLVASPSRRSGKRFFLPILSILILSCPSLDPSAPATVYAGTEDGGVFKSSDGGGSWTAVNDGLTGTEVYALAIDPSAPATVYAGTEDGGVFKSSNGGASWAAVNDGLTSTEVYALAIDPSVPDTLYAGTEDDGVFKSSNGGASWTALNVGLTKPHVRALAVDFSAPSTLHAGTLGGGVFDYTALAPCIPGPKALCLNGGRFQVTTEWSTPDGRTGSGHAVALTGDTGYFTFFDSDNVEMVVKVLDGCGVNARFWTFAGGLTNVSVAMTVLDTRTGDVRTYTNPQGTPFQPIQDTSAFGTCSVGVAAEPTSAISAAHPLLRRSSRARPTRAKSVSPTRRRSVSTTPASKSRRGGRRATARAGPARRSL